MEPQREADVQQLLVVKEEVPPEQDEWSSSLDQEDPEPPHIKEEQDELWISQEGEQLQGLEEADITKFTFTPVPVKSEDDEEEPQSSQLHQRLTEQIKTESEREDCGGAEPARNSGPDRHPEPDTDDKTGDSSDPETDDSDYWKETREPRSGLNSLNNDEDPVSDSRCSAGEKPFSCSECGKIFVSKRNLNRHMITHTGEKPFSCSVCKKVFTQRGSLQKHMRIHEEKKRFSCSVCDQRFTWLHQLRNHQCVGRQSSQLHQTQADGEDCGGPARNSDPNVHLQPDADDKTGDFSEPETDDDWKETREPQSGINAPQTVKNNEVHTGEKRFSCSVCKKYFAQSGGLQKHMRSHTGEKPFRCSVCGKAFSESGNLKVHMRSHTGEKPFSCPFCKKSFAQSVHLQSHMRVHTGEKPFSCPVCGKAFSGSGNLKGHIKTHTHREKRLACSVCDQTFNWLHQLRNHQCAGRQSSQLHQTQHIKTEADEDDCGGSEPARNSEADKRPELDTNDKIWDSNEPDYSVGSELWKKSRTHQSGPMHLKSEEVSVSITGCSTDENPLSSFECHRKSEDSHTLLTRKKPPTGEKPFDCSVCGKAAAKCDNLRSHSGEKPFHCSVCHTGFSDSESLVQHMRIHTTQTQFRCQICGEEFAWRRYLTKHMEVHKIYSCSVCDQRFTRHYQLKYHKCVGRKSDAKWGP